MSDQRTSETVARVVYERTREQRDHWKEQAETLKKLLDERPPIPKGRHKCLRCGAGAEWLE